MRKFKVRRHLRRTKRKIVSVRQYYKKNRAAVIPDFELRNRNIEITGPKKFRRVIKRQLGKQPDLWKYLENVTILPEEREPKQASKTAYARYIPQLKKYEIHIAPELISDKDFVKREKEIIGSERGKKLLPIIVRHETGHIKTAGEIGEEKYDKLWRKSVEKEKELIERWKPILEKLSDKERKALNVSLHAQIPTEKPSVEYEKQYEKLRKGQLPEEEVKLKLEHDEENTS